MAILLFLLWIIWNGKVNAEILLFGTALTALALLFAVKVLGYSLESEVTENRLFPTIIQKFGFGEESYLESLAWQTAAVSFNSGERNRIGFVICDAGGEAYIDELRLFKSADGIAWEAVEDTLPHRQDSADADVPAPQPEKTGVTAVVLWSVLGVLLAAATVILIIILKKRKNKQ